MLQSKTSNYIRLYLKLQRINTKAVWLLPTFTITILLAPYAALPYLLVSLSKTIEACFCWFFFPQRNMQYPQTKAPESGDQLRGPYGLSTTVIREGEQVCLLSNSTLFANMWELVQEKVLFWVVSVACCHARNCEVRFPEWFSTPLQPKRKEAVRQGENWLWRLWDHGRVRDTFLRTARKRLLQRRVSTRKS